MSKKVETSLEDAKDKKLFYVVANVVLVNEVDRTCLLLRRGGNEKEAAGKWAFPGGKAEHGQIESGRVKNFFGIVALAESFEETGLSFDLDSAHIISNGAFVREDGIPVVFATVAATYSGGTLALEQGSFSESGWFTEEQLPPNEECIGTVREEAVMAINSIAPTT